MTIGEGRPRTGKGCHGPASGAWAGLATSTPRFYGVQEALACVRFCAHLVRGTVCLPMGKVP